MPASDDRNPGAMPGVTTDTRHPQAPAAHAAAPRRSAAALSREWLIALDPLSGRFRIDFPDCAGPAQSEERWLMIAIAIGLDDPAFREHIIQSAFERILDSSSSH